MSVREIKPGVHAVGAIDWDRALFDELIPLPDGTSYNSYLVRGDEKVALIDTVDPAKSHELIENLKKLNITHIDYVIANHAEQDHSEKIRFYSPATSWVHTLRQVISLLQMRQKFMNLPSVTMQRS